MDDDISAMRDYWVEVEPPSPGAQDRALATLLNQMKEPDTMVEPVRTRSASTARRRFLPTWAWRAGMATAAAAALAVGLVVTVGPNGDATNGANAPQTPSLSAGPTAEPLELAAMFAAAQPFTAPRPDQWAYVELKIVVPGLGLPDTLRKSWYQIDGSRIAIPDANGHIEITSGVDANRVGPKPALSPHDYPALSTMPTDPQALLTFLRAGLEEGSDADAYRSGALFGLIGYILRENVLPPDLTAALLRAAAEIPGVSVVPGTDTVDGRPVIAVGLVNGWSREDILLDPTTKEFLGSRSVAVADEPAGVGASASPGTEVPRIGGAPAAKTGDLLFVITRGNCTIVDAPGQVG